MPEAVNETGTIESVLHETRLFAPSADFSASVGGAYVESMDQYRALHKRSLDDPEGFWGEIAGEPSCLPLLQFAARQLWERRDRKQRLLLSSAYEKIGGVAGALAVHADGVLAALTGPEQRDELIGHSSAACASAM